MMTVTQKLQATLTDVPQIPTSVTILKNDYDEYQVPDNGDFYFTDDREDAISTARHIHGLCVFIKFRRVHCE